jgi:hypothetical protein
LLHVFWNIVTLDCCGRFGRRTHARRRRTLKWCARLTKRPWWENSLVILATNSTVCMKSLAIMTHPDMVLVVRLDSFIEVCRLHEASTGASYVRMVEWLAVASSPPSFWYWLPNGIWRQGIGLRWCWKAVNSLMILQYDQNSRRFRSKG